MAPDFEKSNEIYFRLGIIYKQQQKYSQSLEVCVLVPSLKRRISNGSAVLQIHCIQSSSSSHRGGHLVPDWPCPRAAKRCKLNQFRPLRAYLTYYRSTTPNLHTGVCLIAIRITQRSSSSSAGCIISRAPASPAKSRRLSTWRSPSIPVCFPFIFQCQCDTELTRGRQQRRAKLVPLGQMLHVTAEVPQGLRGIPTSCLP